MNFWVAIVIIFSIIVLNIIVYFLFKKFLYGKPDAAMKFLVINIAKDILWLGISLAVIEKTNTNFIFLLICFLISSFIIYFLVIKAINKS